MPIRSKNWVEEEGEVFRKGVALLKPEEMEEEYDTEELRKEVCFCAPHLLRGSSCLASGGRGAAAPYTAVRRARDAHRRGRGARTGHDRAGGPRCTTARRLVSATAVRAGGVGQPARVRAAQLAVLCRLCGGVVRCRTWIRSLPLGRGWMLSTDALVFTYIDGF